VPFEARGTRHICGCNETGTWAAGQVSFRPGSAPLASAAVESVFDLPAHPLFVHTPLVLMPLLALAAMAVALRPRWRRAFGPVLILASLALVVVTVMATQSGEAFDKILDEQGVEVDIEDHQSLGETSQIMAIVFAGLMVGSTVVAMIGSGRRGGSGRTPAARPGSGAGGALGLVGHALAVGAVVFGILGSVWMFRTGHEGAKLVWDGTIPAEESGDE